MDRRFRNVLPPEARPDIDDWLMLSSDKGFVARENRRSLQNALEEDSWPKVHYLWRQHPIMQWANDKAGQFFGRQEAALVGMPSLKRGEVVFCIAGTIPNKRSAPLVDEWFGVHFVDGRFDFLLPMDKVIAMTRFDDADQPNSDRVTDEDTRQVSQLLPEAVEQAKAHMTAIFKAYRDMNEDSIFAEFGKLEALKARHESHLQEKYEQLSFFGKEKRQDAEQRHIDQIFQEFYTWVDESMEIENVPYIRIIAAFMGVEA